MDEIALKAFSKINLYLEVINKRPDGYHNIRTIFQSIDLADDVSINKAGKGIAIFCEDEGVPKDSGNIAFKAAARTLEAAGARDGVKIRIRKRVPLLSGLGGGSGDAAAVIYGIDELYGLGLSYKRMLGIAEECGADVPFLIKGGTALGEGKGGILKDLPPLKDTYFVLVKPAGGKPSTKKIYENFKIRLTKKTGLDDNILGFLEKKDKTGGDLAGVLRNDLEEVAVQLVPEIPEIKTQMMKSGALASLMTGSGPTVFGVAGSKKDAERICETLKGRFNWVNIVKSLIPERQTGG
jgi:4-diphosphocytidyl-2-C-methyl-D-erythritol kinase